MDTFIRYLYWSFDTFIGVTILPWSLNTFTFIGVWNFYWFLDIFIGLQILWLIVWYFNWGLDNFIGVWILSWFFNTVTGLQLLCLVVGFFHWSLSTFIIFEYCFRSLDTFLYLWILVSDTFPSLLLLSWGLETKFISILNILNPNAKEHKNQTINMHFNS